jgi:lipooligosaccharide transport system permease protein
MKELTFHNISIWKVYCIWLRYVKLFIRAGIINSLGPVTEPVLYFLTFQYGLSRVTETIMYESTVIPYIDFLLSGMLPISIMLSSIFDASYYTYIQIHERKLWTLFISGPLQLSEVYLGTFLWYVTRSLLTAMIVFLIGLGIGGLSFVHLFKVFPFLVLSAFFFSAFGIFCASLVKNMYQLNLPVFYFVLPMYALCGGYFPNTNFPKILFWISEALPLTMLVDLSRWPLAIPKGFSFKIITTVVLTFFFMWSGYERIKKKLVF